MRGFELEGYSANVAHREANKPRTRQIHDRGLVGVLRLVQHAPQKHPQSSHRQWVQEVSEPRLEPQETVEHNKLAL